MILDVSSGWKGSIHDLRIFERSRLIEKFACFKVKGWRDKGYLGIEGIAKEWEIKKPKKKAKGMGLTDEGRERNREINRGG